MLKELSSYIYEIAYDYIELNTDKLGIVIDEEPSNDLLTIIISNNVNWQLVSNPAYKPSAIIPLLRQVCDICGGRLIVNRKESDSKLTANMQYFNADRPPMGSVPELIQGLIISKPDIAISYTHRYDGREYRISTPEINALLDGVPLDTPSVAHWLKERIGEGIAQIMRDKISE